MIQLDSSLVVSASSGLQLELVLQFFRKWKVPCPLRSSKAR